MQRLYSFKATFASCCASVPALRRPASWKVMTSSLPSGLMNNTFPSWVRSFTLCFLASCVAFNWALAKSFCCAVRLLSLRNHDGEVDKERTNLLGVRNACEFSVCSFTLLPETSQKLETPHRTSPNCDASHFFGREESFLSSSPDVKNNAGGQKQHSPCLCAGVTGRRPATPSHKRGLCPPLGSQPAEGPNVGLGFRV